ncbi:hypothetical protein LCGC14_0680670 [marine sediment metagenome]|uniref:Uncharacterized protein n=1 Tax=marine sediment metagenome TaxID=412755 RepID=A0A0F9R8K5_9ZZZZ
MIFAISDPILQYFTFFSSIEMLLYAIIVGYFMLLFFFFLFIRYRTSKKLYWLFFSVFFLCFGIGRTFFILYYFYAPELYDPIAMNGTEVVSSLMLYFRFATFFTWMGVTCLVGLLGILLLPPEAKAEQGEEKVKSSENWFKDKNNIKIVIRIILIVIPFVIGILALILPDNVFMDPDFETDYNISVNLITVKIGSWEYPIGRFLYNFIMMPILVAIIPFIFLYLAWKTFGVLRKSYALNAFGFFLYWIGRILQGALDVASLPHLKAVLPPLIILIALLIIVIANNYEQLK